MTGRTPPSVVYFIGNATAVKIGVSYNLKDRLKGIRNGCPTPLWLLGCTPGDVLVEREYHRRFASARLHGEWFTRTDEINAEIAELSGVVTAQ